ncbi:unnamed protein product [Sphenostylis stenocarpa]|uniref:Uncharacterized protein n=1 Tax=Sphenostylis stenocarpa TaxID=92480 RepID=A0AA86RUH9_9FABA|nr:unnamed protein product [Sphenostylis stenocarpa]
MADKVAHVFDDEYVPGFSWTLLLNWKATYEKTKGHYSTTSAVSFLCNAKKKKHRFRTVTFFRLLGGEENLETVETFS